MPDILPSDAPYPRAILGWDGTAWRVMAVDPSGHVQVDVLSAALPAGAATAANQATMITALQLIDDLRNALDSVGADELDVNVEASVLPAGAATAANQATQITALQLIDDLTNALISVGTDRLQVRGEDQLHSFADTLEIYVTGALTAPDGYLETDPVGLRGVWVITNIIIENEDRGLSSTRWCRFSGGVVYCFGCETRVIPAAERLCWHGWQWAKESDTLRGQFVGGQIGDTCHMWITGHEMIKAIDGGPPPPGPQDLTTYTEVCVAGWLTVVADRVTAVDVDAHFDCYLYKDFTADYFDALNIQFAIRMDDTSTQGAQCGIALANVVDDKTGFGATALSVTMNEGAANAKNVLLIRGYDVAFDSYVAAGNIAYYCTLTRPAGGDVATLKIYSDLARTVLLDTLTVAGFGTTKWRYMYGFCNYNVGIPGRDYDGFILGLSIG